jgi:hypothetical protein
MGLWCRRWLGFWICNSGGLMMMFVANNKKEMKAMKEILRLLPCMCGFVGGGEWREKI